MADVPLMSNPMTTAGDVIYGGASGAPTRLAIGTAGQVLKVNAGETAVEWGAGSSSYTAFASYSPTWTNVTVGDGTLTARWAQIGTGTGSLVKVQIQLVLGSSSSISGDIIVSLPATSATRNGNFPLGTGMLVDATGGSYTAQVMYATTT